MLAAHFRFSSNNIVMVLCSGQSKHGALFPTPPQKHGETRKQQLCCMNTYIMTVCAYYSMHTGTKHWNMYTSVLFVIICSRQDIHRGNAVQHMSTVWLPGRVSFTNLFKMCVSILLAFEFTLVICNNNNNV